jgi:hypothetical protein
MTLASSRRGRRAVPRLVALALGAALLAPACGARSGPGERQAGPPLDAAAALSGCLGDLDCGAPDACAPVHCVEGACVAGPRVVCDDHDDCTVDTCAPGTGQCDFTPRTRDEDGDGHRGPLPGRKAGAPGACGDDCNDTSPLAFPGGIETCDGVDNDCNGVVDDGARYEPTNVEPVLLSPGAKQAGLGGVAFGAPVFAASFASSGTSWSNTFTAFDDTGAITVPATTITHENTDAFTGPIVWTGSVFALAWEDRRDKDFEIYFNRVDPSGKKLSPDLRVTNAPKFSLRPDLLWDGTEYVVAWSDRREGDAAGRVFGQRIDAGGRLVGGNVPLTPVGEDVDVPRIAKGDTELGLVFTVGVGALRQLFFRTLSADLSVLGPEVLLGSGDVASSAITWSGDRYVVVWDTQVRSAQGDKVPGAAIRGAAVASDGTVLVPERDVTEPAGFARSEAVLPLGDRLLLVWAEAAPSGGSYALYSKMLGRELVEASLERRVTNGPSDSVNPAAAFGPSGDVAVAFEDLRSGNFQVYATRLACVAGPVP